MLAWIGQIFCLIYTKKKLGYCPFYVMLCQHLCYLKKKLEKNKNKLESDFITEINYISNNQSSITQSTVTNS